MGGSQLEHVVLFVRDACGLAPTGDDVPPPLLGGITRIDARLGPGPRAEASTAWLDWWRASIRAEGHNVRGDPPPLTSPTETTAVPADRVDPPDFSSLTSDTGLRRAAVTAWPEALRWWAGQRDQAQNQRQDQSGAEGRHTASREHWQLLSSVADEVVEEYRVDPVRVRAGVIVLAVEGSWSARPEPGILVCSQETHDDADQFGSLLKAAFISGLRQSG